MVKQFTFSSPFRRGWQARVNFGHTHSKLHNADHPLFAAIYPMRLQTSHSVWSAQLPLYTSAPPMLSSLSPLS